jgi:hypothetical protein
MRPTTEEQLRSEQAKAQRSQWNAEERIWCIALAIGLMYLIEAGAGLYVCLRFIALLQSMQYQGTYGF